MLYMSCLRILRGPRKFYRFLCVILVSIPISFVLFALFCSTILKNVIISHLCQSYNLNETSGAFCEEFCSEATPFTNFNCIGGTLQFFSAERNGNVYEFHFATENYDDLAWQDTDGNNVYPKSSDLQHMIKMHLLLNYNVTLEDNVLKRLINHEIDENQPSQIQQFWWLFNNNDYLMTKLFEDEALFPTILGNCGSMYATEQLEIPSKSNRPHKHFNFKTLYEYILRLDMMKPDPVKICRIKLENFGLTADARLKAVNADYMKLESQLHKRLVNGAACWYDSDCDWHDCRGSCQQRICREAPRHDNIQLLCDYVQIFRERFEDLLVQPGMQQFYEEKCKRKYTPYHL